MKIDILNIKIDKITAEETLKKIENFLKSDSNHYIVTVNPEIIIEAQKDKEYQNILNKADLSVADGIGLLWASKFLSISKAKHIYNVIPAKAGIQNRNNAVDSHFHGNDKFNKILYLPYCYTVILLKFIFSGLSLVFYPKYCRQILPERISGVDLIQKIAQKIENTDYSIFLLGGKNKAAELTAQKLKQKFPNLKIAGAEKGIQYSYDLEKQNVGLINRINKIKPDVLFIALGAPKQEKWIAENLEKIPSVKLAIGVGGAFDFISGRTKRAPKFLQKIGLEWLWRFALQPWRAKRIFRATVIFVWKVLKFKTQIKNSPLERG